MSLPVEDKTLRVKGPVRLNPHTYNLDKTEARSTLFTEQEAFWNIPMHETSKIIQTAVTKGTQRQPGRINDDIIHIATVSPISMYSMNPSKQHLTCIDLYDVFPTTRSNVYRPKITLAPLGFPLDQNVVLHEELSNIVLSINFETGEVSRLETTTLLEAATESLTRSFRSTQGAFKMCGDFAHESDGMLLFYKIDGQEVDVVNMLEGRCHSISLPLKVANIQMTSRYDWLITESNTQQKYLLSNSEDKPFDYYLQSIQDTQMGSEDRIDLVATSPLHESLLSGALNQKMKSPNRLLATKDTYATLAVGLPELGTVDMYSVSRERQDNKDLDDRMKGFMSTSSPARRSVPDPTVYLPDSGQVVRALPVWNVPSEVYPQGVKPKNLCGYLEVTDVVSKNLRYIPIPGVTNHNIYNQWYGASTDCQVVMAPMKNDGLVTVDAGGAVRLWETTLFNLDKSVQKWRGLIGDAEFRDLEISERASTTELEEPKHGRVDPTGNPHVGGGTWAGGTGGSNTAGLGGIGGPYRLDAGHDVTQVPDWQKQMVPQEVQQAAREMAEKAFKERLKQIKMSEYDGELYDTYLKAVKGQVKSIRIILDTLQAKGKERQWLKHQAYGDLDEAKLIEGLTGEKAIYKRRGEKEPELGSPQQKPKLMKLLCDVSGSMYRFNGYDGRLEREMEAMLMVMEAFEGYDQKLKYEIIGHSGDGYKFDIVKGDKPPKNNKERMDVLKTLHAHSQFCISGDHTLEATQHAIKTITDTEADEHFVIVLSDANLDRYGIRPKHLSDILTSNDDVNAYVIFIGSLGDQASRLLKQMPSGRAFLCLDTKNLPQILQQIFTSTMLNTR